MEQHDNSSSSNTTWYNMTTTTVTTTEEGCTEHVQEIHNPTKIWLKVGNNTHENLAVNHAHKEKFSFLSPCFYIGTFRELPPSYQTFLDSTDFFGNTGHRSTHSSLIPREITDILIVSRVSVSVSESDSVSVKNRDP